MSGLAPAVRCRGPGHHLAVVTDAVTLFALLPPAAALTDAVFFGAVLAVISVFMVRADRVQQRLVRALEEQARVDPLTRPVNRRVFDDELAQTLTGRPHDGTALVLNDVDSVKTINDSHGGRHR